MNAEDFYWSYTQEPHATRRQQILESHPEVKKCFGIDRSFKFVVLAMVLFQTFAAYLLKDSSWLLVAVQAYAVSATVSHSLTLAIHECAHNLGFGYDGRWSTFFNRVLGFIANLPCGVPLSISFKKYHLEHHRYLGENVFDTDVPTEFEARVFTSALGKLVWLTLQPIFYAFRPFLLYQKSVTDMEIANLIVQLVYDYLILHYFGVKAFVYLFGGFMVGLGLHPSAAHFISDHYMFKSDQETYSYYGPLNYVTFNVGYHTEHHDFPFVCGKNLPKIREIAPEFYDGLEIHNSWIALMYNFIVDPKLSLRSRMKRSLAPETARNFYSSGPFSSSNVYTIFQSIALFLLRPIRHLDINYQKKQCD